jgi:hypothetical protein
MEADAEGVLLPYTSEDWGCSVTASSASQFTVTQGLGLEKRQVIVLRGLRETSLRGVRHNEVIGKLEGGSGKLVRR